MVKKRKIGGEYEDTEINRTDKVITMASTIWLGGLSGSQDETVWDIELDTSLRGSGLKAIIAKGNIIEGIKAKW